MRDGLILLLMLAMLCLALLGLYYYNDPAQHRRLRPVADADWPVQDFWTFFGLDAAAPQGVLPRLLGDRRRMHGVYAINLGANDGKTLDPLYPLYAAGAGGVLVEYSAELMPALQAHVPWARARKLQRAVTPRTVAALLLEAGVPRAPDVLKIDIDGFDVSVLEALLRNGSVAPRVLIAEINEKVPPPIQFAVNQYVPPPAWRGDHCYGASLEKLAQALRACAYEPVALDWNNLYLLPRAELERLEHAQHARLDTRTRSLYETGYWRRVGRAAAFPWNADVDAWAARVLDGGAVAETMRAIFEYMLGTASFRESRQLTFELSLAPGVAVV